MTDRPPAPPQPPLLLTHSTTVMPALVPAAPARVAPSFVATEYVPPVSIALASPEHGWDGDIEVAADSTYVEDDRPLPEASLPEASPSGAPVPVPARRTRGVVAVCAAIVVIVAAAAAVALWPRGERAPRPPSGADAVAATTAPVTRPPAAQPAPIRAPRPVPAPAPEAAAAAPPTTAAPAPAPAPARAPVVLAEKPGAGAKPKTARPQAAAGLGAK